MPHTPWRLLEHLRIAQWDILWFSIDPRHVSPEFPAGYWPEGDAPPDPDAWDRTIAAFQADQKAVMDLMAYRETGARGPTSEGRIGALFSGTLTPKPWLAPGSENGIGRVTNRRIPLKDLAFFPLIFRRDSI